MSPRGTSGVWQATDLARGSLCVCILVCVSVCVCVCILHLYTHALNVQEAHEAHAATRMWCQIK